jgi:N-methylhydantoinase B
VIAPGEWRGGIGSVRVFTYLTDGGFSVEGDGQKHRPWGFDGETDGLPGELIMETKAGTRLALPSKVPYQKAARGDRLLAYGPSGYSGSRIVRLADTRFSARGLRKMRVLNYL